ncbi:hypothetical protein [Novosphingobium sp. BL-8A]|uniref:hypothetical protein n=1 Tax=Novosphingobium sp. BL-8A TaxID=3127639 RepID=UPI003757484B
MLLTEQVPPAPSLRKGIAEVLGAVARNTTGLGAKRHEFTPGGRSKVAEGQQLVEMAYSDSRHFSAICGSRETIRTRVHVDHAWQIGKNTGLAFPTIASSSAMAWRSQ